MDETIKGLRSIVELISSLDVDALGVGHSYYCAPWSIRDEVCHNLSIYIEQIEAMADTNLLCELYQILGALDADDKVLDQVSAAIRGDELPYDTLLPYFVEDDFVELPNDIDTEDKFIEWVRSIQRGD